MDISRNEAIFKDIEKRDNIKIKTLDIDQRLIIKHYYKTKSDITTLRFDCDDSTLAVGCADGTVNLYDAHKADKSTPITYQTQDTNTLQLPVTCLRQLIRVINRWHSAELQTQNKFILISSNTDGTIIHWNTKLGVKINQFKEEDENEIYGIDLNQKETLFATCGKDCKIRIYDEDTVQLAMTMQAIEWASPGHNNRVFAVKFVPDDFNLLLSGGWDQTINIWDMRKKGAVATFIGPKIAGDAIDIQNNVILTGSNKMSEQLQLYDLRTQKQIQDIRWDVQEKPNKSSPGAFVYSCEFSKLKLGSSLVMGGAYGTNDVRIFEANHDKFYSLCAGVDGFSKGIYTVDFANLSNQFALGGGDGIALIFSISQAKEKK